MCSPLGVGGRERGREGGREGEGRGGRWERGEGRRGRGGERGEGWLFYTLCQTLVLCKTNIIITCYLGNTTVEERCDDSRFFGNKLFWQLSTSSDSRLNHAEI